jgi:hypothetical protein
MQIKTVKSSCLFLVVQLVLLVLPSCTRSAAPTLPASQGSQITAGESALSSAVILSPTLKPTRTPTPIPSPTPKPEPATFDNTCSLMGQTVELEGILHLPDEISCTTTGSPNTCTVELIDPDRDGTLIVDLNVSANSSLPKNMMAELPWYYDYSDFRVKTAAGEMVGEGALVRVSGVVAPPIPTSAGETGCSLAQVNLIRKIDGLSLAAVEKLIRSDLNEAVEKGWLSATISGIGLSQIEVRLQSLVDTDLELSIPPGTIFESRSPDVQNMVLRRGTLVVLKPRAEISLDLEVSCANMDLEEPTSSNQFSISREGASADLLRLLSWQDYPFESLRVQQFAVWTITDNPERAGYARLSNLDGGEGSGPDEGELEAIYTLFRQAGIDPSQYQAFSAETSDR